MHDRTVTDPARTPAGALSGSQLSIMPLRPADFDDWARARAASFGRELHPAAAAKLQAVIDPARALAVRDGTEIVATAHTSQRMLTVPSGCIAAGHVTAVSVLPTHRRRGILSAMMDRQLADGVERGEPVAVLGASEAGIYRRYGFGVAVEKAALELSRDHADFAAPPPVDAGRVRLVNRSTALQKLPMVYDAVGDTRVGMLSRTPAAWSQALPESAAEGAIHQAVHETDQGHPDGYAVYRTQLRWNEGLPAGELTVTELLATSPVTEEALWRYVAGVDLVATITAPGRPVDDALPWMLADPRRLQRRPADALWLRILDVQAALSSRAYGCNDALVLQVIDNRAPGWAAGHWLLEATTKGATVSRTSRPATLVLEAADLAAAYLGAVSFTTLARAGRVHGQLEDVRRADRLFAWTPAPWTP